MPHHRSPKRVAVPSDSPVTPPSLHGRFSSTSPGQLPGLSEGFIPLCFDDVDISPPAASPVRTKASRRHLESPWKPRVDSIGNTTKLNLFDDPRSTFGSHSYSATKLDQIKEMVVALDDSSLGQSHEVVVHDLSDMKTELSYSDTASSKSTSATSTAATSNEDDDENAPPPRTHQHVKSSTRRRSELRQDISPFPPLISLEQAKSTLSANRAANRPATADAAPPSRTSTLKPFSRSLGRSGARPTTSTGPSARATLRPLTAPMSVLSSPLPSPFALPVEPVQASASMGRRRPYTAPPTRPATAETRVSREDSPLKDVLIELWIDQEGFRAIRPQFSFVRYNPETTDPNSNRSYERQQPLGDAGLAQFKMKNRQTWHFHHAIFDERPIIRRMTVDGNENVDYLTKQAHLTIKGHGVYIVRGTEGKGKLTWKFEYLVDDRLDVNGLAMPGEKTFTPLSFACSPDLLSTTQGKTVKLLHIIRKKITPKLSSSKLEPPAFPISDSQRNLPFDSIRSLAAPETTTGTVSKTFDAFAKAVVTVSRPSTPKTPRLATPKNARPSSSSSAAATPKVSHQRPSTPKIPNLRPSTPKSESQSQSHSRKKRPSTATDKGPAQLNMPKAPQLLKVRRPLTADSRARPATANAAIPRFRPALITTREAENWNPNSRRPEDPTFTPKLKYIDVSDASGTSHTLGGPIASPSQLREWLATPTELKTFTSDESSAEKKQSSLRPPLRSRPDMFRRPSTSTGAISTTIGWI